MKNRIRGALVALVMLLTSAFAAVAASPAQALPGCLTQTICFYNSASDPGPIQVYPGSVTRNTCLDVPDNLTSYVQNRTGVRWVVYQLNNCTDINAPIYPNTAGAMNSLWNNAIKAVVRTSSTSKHEGPLPAGAMVID